MVIGQAHALIRIFRGVQPHFRIACVLAPSIDHRVNFDTGEQKTATERGLFSTAVTQRNCSILSPLEYIYFEPKINRQCLVYFSSLPKATVTSNDRPRSPAAQKR